MKTIIDILKRGNLELFHSSIFAWLIDPKAEHFQNIFFLKRIAQLLFIQGEPELLAKIQNNPSIKVDTEIKSKKGRYDIAITTDDLTIIFENKTKSIGSIQQLSSYNSDSKLIVALGFHEINFPKNVHTNFPFISYRDLADILESLPELNCQLEFKILIEQYLKFLKRELQIIELIDKVYRYGKVELHDNLINLTADHNSNDIDKRFYNLYFLESFKRNSLNWKGSIWTTDKNMISGPWLADFKKSADSFQFGKRFRNFSKQNLECFYFHLQIKNGGIFVKKLDDIAGEIQLRCESKIENKRSHSNFKEIYNLKNNQKFSSAPRKKSGTFYLVKEPLQKKIWYIASY